MHARPLPEQTYIRLPFLAIYISGRITKGGKDRHGRLQGMKAADGSALPIQHFLTSMDRGWMDECSAVVFHAF